MRSVPVDEEEGAEVSGDGFHVCLLFEVLKERMRSLAVDLDGCHQFQGLVVGVDSAVLEEALDVVLCRGLTEPGKQRESGSLLLVLVGGEHENPRAVDRRDLLANAHQGRHLPLRRGPANTHVHHDELPMVQRRQRIGPA